MQKVAKFYKVSYEQFLKDWMDSFGDKEEVIKEIAFISSAPAMKAKEKH